MNLNLPSNYVELHRHSENSHDASGKAEWAAQYAKAIGQTALGLTEHGNIDSLMTHYSACKREGIKPVLGCEIYFQPVFRKPNGNSARAEVIPDEDLGPEDSDDRVYSNHSNGRYHLTVLCETVEGYQNLCKLITLANQESFYRVPIVTLERLRQYGKGLIFLTGCISGYVAQSIVLGESELGLRFVTELQHIAGPDNVFLEVQPFVAPGQMDVNTVLCQWSELYAIPLVMTSDAHFIKPSDYPYHQLMQLVRKPYMDGQLNDFSVRHIHTGEEMQTAWYELMGSTCYADRGDVAIMNTGVIANRCDVVFDKSFKMPDLQWLDQRPEQLLPTLVGRGLRSMGKTSLNERGQWIIQKPYADRVVAEIQIMSERGFIPYILLVNDIVDFCRRNDILVNGRGSGCGSEVAHALGFHMVDAVKHDVDFALFISQFREGYPDFDLDIQDNRKQEVVEYVLSRYPEQAAQISTFNCFKQRALIAGIVKASGMDDVEAAIFRQAMFHFPDTDIPIQMFLSDVHLVALDKKYGVVSAYCYMYGQVNHTGKHPAGVAITNGPITDYMAVKRVGSGSDINYVTCMDMAQLDEAGILKVDLLGLAGLTVVKEALGFADIVLDNPSLTTECRTSLRNDGKLLDAFRIEKIINDEAMLAEFSAGNTLGIFQSEKGTPKRMYMQLRPQSVLDLAIVTACNRPLPLKEKTFDTVVAGRKGNGGNNTPWSDVLAETYGGIVYQDQVRRIAIEIAGLTPGQADQVLMGLKKYHENDPALEKLFIVGCINTSAMTTQQAEDLWASTKRYLFKKAHALAYAYLAALEQWLKVNYPLAFYLALLRNEGDDSKRRIYAADAMRHSIPILLPHVNGEAGYSTLQMGSRSAIQEGLLHLPGIGPSTANDIMAEKIRNGPYLSEDDARKRCAKMKLATLEKFGAISFGDDYRNRVREYQNHLTTVPSSLGG